MAAKVASRNQYNSASTIIDSAFAAVANGSSAQETLDTGAAYGIKRSDGYTSQENDTCCTVADQFLFPVL